MIALKNEYLKSVNIDALLHLLDYPENVQDIRAVYDEVIERYFVSREFCLYNYLVKNRVMDMDALVKTVSIELTRSDENPHAAEFINAFLKLLDTIQKQKEQGLGFELNMLNPARFMEMADGFKKNPQYARAEYVQQVNKIIDMMNEQQAAEEQKLLPAATEANLAVAAPPIKTYTIAVSKMRKEELVSALDHLDEYFPKDQEKIVKTAIKKYPDEIASHAPIRLFEKLLDETLCPTILSDTFEKLYRFHMEGFFGKLCENYSQNESERSRVANSREELLEKIKAWCEVYVKDFTPEVWEYLLQLCEVRLGLKTEDDVILNAILPTIDEFYQIYAHANVDTLFAEVNLAHPLIYPFRYYIQGKNMSLDKLSLGKIVVRVSRDTKPERPINQYFKYREIVMSYVMFCGVMLKGDWDIDWCRPLPPEAKASIERFLLLPLDWDFTGYQKDMSGWSQFGAKEILLMKACRARYFPQEIEYFFFTEQGAEELRKELKSLSNHQGTYTTPDDYFADMLQQLLSRYDFRNETMRIIFFGFHFVRPFTAQPGQQKMNFIKEIIDKLHLELPDEYEGLCMLFGDNIVSRESLLYLYHRFI